MTSDLVRSFAQAVESSDGLAEPALIMARLDHPRFDPAPYLSRLDQMGTAARQRIDRRRSRARTRQSRESLDALNDYLYGEVGLGGIQDQDDDTRGSFLSDVLDGRQGIPVSLGVVYLEVARRAGLRIEGVTFPGHFLVLCPLDEAAPGEPVSAVLDPFSRGRLLSERDCRDLLHERLGDQVSYHPVLLAPASRQQILARMLLHLKRVYITLRSFPQARLVTELLMVVSPSALEELRDRGLLAYHLRDFPAALRDLETYLKLAKAEDTEESREERSRIWEHIKTLRRRVAGYN
jgi:regulator of sirC expression with transglutaminase-like and TPR domain